MPILAQCHAESTPLARMAARARVKCTDTIATHFAGGAAVCRAQQEVSCHFFTAQGKIAVRMPLTAFCAAFRGPMDANNNPLPGAGDIERQHDAEEARAVAEWPRPDALDYGDSPAGLRVIDGRSAYSPTGKRLDAARIAAMRAAWIAHRAAGSPLGGLTRIAKEIHSNTTTLHTYFRRFDREQIKLPIAKPNGKIL